MPSYQSFSGADIVATFNGVPIGELLSVTYSVTREKAPNYTMGYANPRGYARGKRGIAGNLVFAVFDRNALLSEMRNHSYEDFEADKDDVGQFHTFGEDEDENAYSTGKHNPDKFNEMVQKAMANGNNDLLDDATVQRDVKYADQLMPFDIVLNFQNEMGEQAKLSIYGCEILNEGMGFSIQDLSTNVQYSFVAKDIEEFGPVDDTGTPSD